MKTITADIITIGDEILYGQILDTNSQWMSVELNKIGIKINRKISISDSESEILAIIKEASERSDIVLMTGGLGPTNDDITKKTIAKYYGADLVINEEALDFVRDFFEKRGRELTEINRLQAALPTNCVYLPNKTGTAPGMWFDENNTVLVSMPGVPHEMKYLMEFEVIPRLKTRFETPKIVHRNIRTAGIGESMLAELIAEWENQLPAHIRLAYLPSFGQVRLRLTGLGNSTEILEKEIASEIEKVLPLIHKFVFSLEDENLEVAIGRLLNEKKATLAVAESCTGGYIAHLLTSIAGSSAYFLGGVVSYANEVKMSQLGVKAQTLTEYGAVSKETIIEMAEGVRKKLHATYGIATSGIAGPDGGTPDKPVGTVWIAVSTDEKTVTHKLQLGNQRITNIQYSSFAVLNLLRLVINKEK